MKSILYINKGTSAAAQEKRRKVQMNALLRKVKIENDPGDELPEDAELLMFKGFAHPEVNQFLADLKKNGVRVDLKCIETETNRDWPLKKLYEELKAEHEALH